MTKKTLNQNAKYVQKLINIIEPDFVFSEKPINRFKIIEKDHNNNNQNKAQKLSELKNVDMGELDKITTENFNRLFFNK